MKLIAFAAAALLGLSASAAPAAPPRLEQAVLAGGCFWGMEGVFEHVKGVRFVVSGYAGGAARDANYDAVSSERTGHAEAVRITYDPAQISYAQLLKIYATVAHDPTQVNRQGPDSGTSYRSAIFPLNAAQKQAAITLPRPVAGVAHLFAADRDADRRWRLLSGRSRAPGLHAAAPVLPVHPGQRPAQAVEAEGRLPAILEGVAAQASMPF